MYGDDFVKEYIGIVRGIIDWEEPFERYQVKNVIVPPKSHLARSLLSSHKWARLYQDELSVVFSRRSETLARGVQENLETKSSR
jgi:hypothetical protein